MSSKTGDLDSTTKNIVKELMRECTNRNVSITEEFIIFYVKLLMLDPSWGITADKLPDRTNVIRFVTHGTNRIENQYCPRVRTLKMQLYFQVAYDNIENMIIKNRTDLKDKLSPLENEILETETESSEELQKLYKKMLYLITLYSGLGNPTIEGVYKEAEAALKSIFLEPDQREFINQQITAKELQIVELTELVTGIRLFNKDCQKGGAGIEDLPKMLGQAIEATNNDIHQNLIMIMDFVNMLTTAIDNCHKSSVDENDNYFLDQELPQGVTSTDLAYATDLLILYRQKELFVRKILVAVGKLEKKANETFEKLQEALVTVHETVRFRIAVPTIQVFPLFSDIANIWCQLQDQTIALSQFNQILLNLTLYTRDLVPNENIIKAMIGPEGPMTDAARLERTAGLTIGPLDSDVEILDPIDIKDFDQVQLQYLGFCAWKLIETKGGLIPGDPNMGVVKIENLYYVFSTPEAAKAFGRNPVRYILRGLDLARSKRPLIEFLQLREQLKAVQQIEKLVVEIPKPIVTYDVEVQTDLHSEPVKIDQNYMWNVWDWKRQAILLANLSKCATHSTQTVKSNAWNAVRTQTYDKKQVICQTKKDNYTNVPTLSNFIYGLRGRKHANQHIVTLTRPVDE